MRITIDQIMELHPCDSYTSERVTELWNGREALTLVEICDLPISVGDRIWALAHLLPKSETRHYACDCADRVVHLTTDPRAAHAIEVSRSYADGMATEEELTSAWSAASGVVRSTAQWSAAWYAARAASAAAWAAASAAASAAAWAASGVATSAWVTAANTEIAWQIARLREICERLEVENA